MQSFHDNKLWQDAYMAAMDVYTITGASDDEILAQVRKNALSVLSNVADAQTRRDRREKSYKISDASGNVAALRSLLSVAWGQQSINDQDFKKIDTSYDALGKKLAQ